MKRFKLFPSLLMLVLCVGALAIGVYAASPITGTINGTINITAAQGVKIAVYRGASTAAVDLIDSAFGSSEVELSTGGATLDASSATSPEQVTAQIYTLVLSTNQATKYVINTETIQVVDGVGLTTGEAVKGAAVITKLHKPYDDTKDENGRAYFTIGKPYTIQISIKCGKLSTEAVSVGYDIDVEIHESSAYTGEAGVNGIDYLYFGEYPQTLSTETTGFVATGETFKAYNDDATKTSEIETERAVYAKDGKRYVGMLVDTVMKYYQIQPLKWRILGSDISTGITNLVCDAVIEQVYYQQFRSYTRPIIDGVLSNTIWANEYEYSTLRKFLTNMFYNSAFDTSEQTLIKQTTMDDDELYDADPIYDNVFAMSTYEVEGAGTEKMGNMQVSDYALATGAKAAGYWWTRTPSADDLDFAEYVFNISGGTADGYDVDYSDGGCVPALNISL